MKPNKSHVGPRKAQHPLFRVWAGMKTRSQTPSSSSWKWYGAKGITVSEDWQHYDAFFRDMIAGWAPGLTLERIDNSAGYCKENCRWATRSEQLRNTSRSKKFDAKAVAAALGLTPGAIYKRNRRGQPLDSPSRYKRSV